MKVQQLMSWPVRTCGPHDSLEQAAQLLWEQDCGVLPVVDEKNRVHALITDRDICMGAYTRGKRLSDLTVADSMSRTVATCGPDDDIAIAAQRMTEHAVRRLPVVDDEGQIRGIVSLSDLARASEHDKAAARAASHVLLRLSRPRPVGSAPPSQAPRSNSVAPRPAAPAPKEARGTVLLSSKTDVEC
jgi:CBS domain-containing protein